jgi:aminopeptidase N
LSEEGLAKVLSALKDKDIIKPQDLIAWYGTLLRRPFAEEAIWNWAQTEWDWIKQSLGGDMSYVAFIIIPSASSKASSGWMSTRPSLKRS